MPITAHKLSSGVFVRRGPRTLRLFMLGERGSKVGMTSTLSIQAGAGHLLPDSCSTTYMMNKGPVRTLHETLMLQVTRVFGLNRPDTLTDAVAKQVHMRDMLLLSCLQPHACPLMASWRGYIFVEYQRHQVF
jgi:hypothetical protein